MTTNGGVIEMVVNQEILEILEIICYRCQQSVEKSLKGFLCANGIEFKKIMKRVCCVILNTDKNLESKHKV